MNANRATVLVVEDEEAIRRFLCVSLESENLRVVEARDCASAELLAQRFRPDIYLLDLGLPDMDGVRLIARLRTWTRNPIIVVTARSDEGEKVRALDAGADDYLTKPFGIRELKARLHVAMRHLVTLEDPNASARFRLGDIEVDLTARRLHRGGEEIRLTPTEFRLLVVLARNPQKVITQRTLLIEVWGPAFEKETHYLRIYFKQMRAKLEPNPAEPRYLITEPGVGYRLLIDPA